MDYERISRKRPSHQFSPAKLRAILLGVQKRQQKEKEDDFQSRLRSDCSTSTDAESGMRDHVALARVAPRVRSQEEEELEFESVAAVSSQVVFEFHRQERALQRPALLSPFSKPTPSKWDDAEKWIASPASNRGGKPGGVPMKKSGLIGYGSRNPVAQQVVMEIGAAKKEMDEQKAVNSGARHALIADNPVAESAVSLNQHASSQSVHDTTTLITQRATTKSIAMIDMGTEMTPIASQEPSRTGTPVRATPPTRSPTSSCPPTPPRKRMTLSEAMVKTTNCHEDSGNKELPEQELQMEVSREILVLGTKLGKENIAAWARKEQEETDVSTSPKTVSVDHTFKSVIENRAATWEEAEKVKYLARFKQEEIKIQAWENHQKAKAEAEMRKTEVEVERMRTRTQDRLMKNLAALSHKAEEKRAEAEAKRNKQATKTADQAEYIRRTGRIPSSFSFWGRYS